MYTADMQAIPLKIRTEGMIKAIESGIFCKSHSTTFCRPNHDSGLFNHWASKVFWVFLMESIVTAKWGFVLRWVRHTRV